MEDRVTVIGTYGLPIMRFNVIKSGVASAKLFN